MGTLSSQDSYIAAWLIERSWLSLEERQQQFQIVTQSQSKFSFLESLFNQQLLLFKQFETALQESLKINEATCLTCEKKYWGRFQKESPPLCKECSQPLKISPSSPDPIPGNILGGCLVVRKLGEGGMGAVYLALHQRLNKWVALKILPKFLTQTNQEGQRFLLEARSASLIEHNSVVGVLDVGEDHGCHFMIQQFIDGPSLREWFVQKKEGITVAEILPLLKGICRGLYYAHKQQIVHRDIKPDNILLTLEGKPKIADFGIAKLQNSARSVSIPGTIMGTPHYMSPEQAEGMNVDHRTDIYSLGIMLFEFLTGKVPFDADSPMSILLKHVEKPVPNPCELNPTLDPLFAKILLKFLEKDPEKRFQDCYQILEAIQAYEKKDFLTLQKMGISLDVPTRFSFSKKNRIVLGVVFFLMGVIGIKGLFFSSQKGEDSKDISNQQTTPVSSTQISPNESPKHFFLQVTSLSSLEDLKKTFFLWERESKSNESEETKLELTRHLQHLILNSNLRVWLQKEEQEILAKQSEPQEALEQVRKISQFQKNLERKGFTLPENLPHWDLLIQKLQFLLFLSKGEIESACRFLTRIEQEGKELPDEVLQLFREQLEQYISDADENSIENIDFFKNFFKRNKLFKDEDRKRLQRLLSRKNKNRWSNLLLSDLEKNDFTSLEKKLQGFEQFLLSCCVSEESKRLFCILTPLQQDKYEEYLDDFLDDFEAQIRAIRLDEVHSERIRMLLNQVNNLKVPDFNLIKRCTVLVEDVVQEQNKKPWKELTETKEFLEEAKHFVEYFFQTIQNESELLQRFKLKIRVQKRGPIWNSLVIWQRENSEEYCSLFFHLPVSVYGNLAMIPKMNPPQIYSYSCFLFLENEMIEAKKLSSFVLNSNEKALLLKAFPLFQVIIDTKTEEK